MLISIKMAQPISFSCTKGCITDILAITGKKEVAKNIDAFEQETQKIKQTNKNKNKINKQTKIKTK